MHYELTTLPNGIRVITESMPEIHSAAVGCWVDTGSRDETPAEAGCSHFLEHLLFKGSERLSAVAIADAFDAVGAQSNAFTSREATCFWARLRDSDLPMGLELLAEMLLRPAFREHEIDAERHVVLEEINMNEDDPTDVAHEEFTQALWQGNPLELPILGTRESITGMARDTIAGYWRRRYGPGSVVVAVAGNIDHAAVVSQVEAEFGDWTGGAVDHTVIEPEYRPRVRVRTRDTEQAHLVIGGPGVNRDDKRRFAAGVLSHVLGGGMSSRLFREIREERGLAYSVYSFRMPHRETGAWGIYAGTTPAKAREVFGIIRSQLAEITANGITEDELVRAKGHVAGSMAISAEDASSRMTRIGRSELADMEHLSIEEVVARFDAVTGGEVLDIARELLSGPLAIGAAGPFDSSDFEEFVA
jgi:predicted Zn-dependent peptidase